MRELIFKSNNLNVLKSIKRYEDLPINPLLQDFTYIENLDIGVVFTEDGWIRYS